MNKRFYVTMTWHDWPEGGSYGTVVEAKDHEEAEDLCRAEMKRTMFEEYEYDDDELEDRDRNWHVVDCFDLDEFIKNHQPKIA